MASSESAPTVLNQERQPEVFSFWAFAHIHPQRMGWKVLYVVNMHQKEEKLSLCSRLSLETESEFKLRTLRWTIARAAVAGNIIWHLHNRHGEIVGRNSYFSNKALVRGEEGEAWTPGFVNTHNTDLFRSYSWKNLHWLRGRWGEVLIQAYEIVLKRQMLDLQLFTKF